MIQKLKSFSIKTTLLAVSVALMSSVAVTYAAPASGCVVGNEAACSTHSATSCDSTPQDKDKKTGDKIDHCTDPAASAANTCTQKSCNIISNYVNPLITLLSALVGVAVTISIIIGGIQYGSSGGDPQKVSAAKNRIRNSIVALVAFMFLYAFLQFIVPGGIFRT